MNILETAGIEPELRRTFFSERDFAISLATMPDPQHFADGQRWATAGLRVLTNVIPRETARWLVLQQLFHHFDAGGTIKPAVDWLQKYHAFGFYDCRCVMSYVVRWVRVRQVERRVTQSLDITNSPSKSLRHRILVLMPSQHLSQVLAAPNEPLTIQVDFGSALTPAERGAFERLMELGMVQGIEIGITSYGQRVYKITFSPIGARWLAEGARTLPDVVRLQSAMEGFGRALQGAAQAIVDSILKRPSPLFPCDPRQPHFVTGEGTAFASMDPDQPPVEIGTMKAGEFTITKRLIALPQGDNDDQD